MAERNNHSTDSKRSKKRSDGEEEMNLELTMKTKLSKNNYSYSLNKNDSLMYSNATYFGIATTPQE